MTPAIARLPAATRSAIADERDMSCATVSRDMPVLELVDAAQPFAAAHQDRRRHPFHHVAHETARYRAVVERGSAWP